MAKAFVSPQPPTTAAATAATLADWGQRLSGALNIWSLGVIGPGDVNGAFLPLTGGTLTGSLVIEAGNFTVVSGNATIAAGTLFVGGHAQFGDNVDISGTLGVGGVLDANDGLIVTNGASFNGTGAVAINSGPLIVNGGSILLSAGTMTVDGSLVQTGTQTVTGAIVLNGTSLGGAGGLTSVVAGAGITTSRGSTGGTISTAGTLYDVRSVNAQTGTTYAIADGDQEKLVTLSNTAAVAASIGQAGAAGSFLAGWSAVVQNFNSGLVTITPTTSTINGIATQVLQAGQASIIFDDGTNYFSLVGSPLHVLANNALSTRLPGFPTAALGGNARGAQAVDIQAYISTGIATQVASGAQSVAVGVANTASGVNSISIGELNVASGTLSIAMGISTASANNTIAMGNSTASAVGATAIGESSTAQGVNSVGIGASVNADGNGCIAIGQTITVGLSSSFINIVAIGSNINADGSNSHLLGFEITDRNNIGAFVHSGVNLGGTTSNLGRSQEEIYILVNSTAAASAVRLTANGAAAGSTNVGALGSASAMLFTIDLTITDITTGTVLSYTLGPSLIVRPTTAATTAMGSGNPSFVAGPTAGSPSALVAAPTVAADTTNGGFNLSYTPPTGNTDTLYAVARLRILNTRYN